MRIDARFFDGLVTSGRPVVLTAGAPGSLRLEGAGADREYAYAELRIPGRVANTPRHVALPGGGACVVADNDALDRLEAELHRAAPALTGGRAFRRGVDRIARLLERNAAGAGLALAVAAGILFAAARWGAPALGGAVVAAIPPENDAGIGEQVLRTFEQVGLFEPTAVSAGRRAELEAMFEPIREDLGVDARLEIRKAGRIGNAYAFPGGTVVLTDAIIERAVHDEELIAVMAHELGHVRERHWLRMLAQSAALLIVWSAATDPTMTTLAALAPATLVELSYSREFEREADRIALDYLARHGVPASRLGDLLDRLMRACGDRCDGPSWLSSHPRVAERAAD